MPQTILVIDDYEPVRYTLSHELKRAGFAVAVAADGEEGLRMLKEGLRPCLIVLDLVMPKMDAWDFMESKHRDEELRDIPVLVSSVNLEIIAVPQGVCSTLEAPWEPAEFMARVRSLCRLAAPGDQSPAPT